MMSIIAVHKN